MKARTAAQRGFSLIELAVVLAAASVLALVLSGHGSNVAGLTGQRQAEAELERARQAVRSYLLRHHRLPCPGSSSAPLEAADRCPAGYNRGPFPYHSLGLEPPGNGPALYYAVHRGNGRDLVDPLPMAVDGNGLDRRGGIEHALAGLARLAGTDRSQPHHPSQPQYAGQADCSQGRQSNPAYLLVAAGQRTANGLDALHHTFFSSNTYHCTASPDRPVSAHDHDRVLSESASTLLGWLLRSARG